MRRWVGYVSCCALGLLLGVVLANVAANRSERLPQERERGYRDRIANLESALARTKPVSGEHAQGARIELATSGVVDTTAISGAVPPSSNSTLHPDRQQQREPILSAEEIRALIRKGDLKSSMRAALSIVELKNLQTELALVRELFAFGDPAARYAALVVGDSLRWPPEAADLWCILLREGQESDWRSRAADTLARMGNPVALPALEEAFQKDNLQVQKDAAIAIEKLGRSGAREEMIGRLVPKLDDPDGSLRRTAVVYMGELGTSSVLPHLGRALADPDSDVRWRAVQSLEHTCLKRAIPFLERALTDSNPNIADGARRAIEKLEQSGRSQ